MPRGLWPTRVITPARFVYLSQKQEEEREQEPLQAHLASDVSGYRFREDSFDPIARIRRGRFYHAGQTQPMRWDRCTHYPGFLLDGIDPYVHAHSKNLDTFYAHSIWQDMQGKQDLPVVLFGVDKRCTTWTIISIEAIFTGEDLVTLKARNSFGILPTMIDDKIPLTFQAKFHEILASFADEVHRSSPKSVIDRARDVATYALLVHLNCQKNAVKDLGKLINQLDKEQVIAQNCVDKEQVIAQNCAHIIARLHARGKPAKQEKRQLRSIREQDADLAVQCVGTLLCELDLAG